MEEVRQDGRQEPGSLVELPVYNWIRAADARGTVLLRPKRDSQENQTPYRQGKPLRR